MSAKDFAERLADRGDRVWERLTSGECDEREMDALFAQLATIDRALVRLRDA